MRISESYMIQQSKTTTLAESISLLHSRMPNLTTIRMDNTSGFLKALVKYSYSLNQSEESIVLRKGMLKTSGHKAYSCYDTMKIFDENSVSIDLRKCLFTRIQRYKSQFSISLSILERRTKFRLLD